MQVAYSLMFHEVSQIPEDAPLTKGQHQLNLVTTHFQLEKASDPMIG